MIAATLTRRWRSLRLPVRAAISLLTIAGLIGVWFAFWWLSDPWPARATLKTPGETWPLAFSPDGREFLTSGDEGISRWDVATGDKKGNVWAIPGGETAFLGTFSPDGRTFAAVCAGKSSAITIRKFDRASGRILRDQPVPFQSCWALKFVNDGRTLRAFLGNIRNPNEGMTAITWDASTSEELSNRPLSASIKRSIETVSADGRTMAIGPMNKIAVELWDLDADRSLGSVMNPNSTSVVCWGGVGLTADGKMLAVSREDGTLEIWDVATKTLRSTDAIGRRLTGIRFSPDARTLAADAHFLVGMLTFAQIAQSVRQMLGIKGQEYGEVMVVDLATGRRLARAADAIQPHFSPDGQTIATRQLDRSLKLRDAPRPR